MRLLVGDVAAVIRHLGRDKATIVGHDWGGAVAWQFALNLPAMTERLIVLNLPHPSGFIRELRTNPTQIRNSEYARTFQQGASTDPAVFFGRPMTAQTLSGWVTDPAARARYVEAFGRWDFDAMLNYYKANYPKASGPDLPPPPELPKLKMPVLMFHGLGDTALHADGLAGTWNWLVAVGLGRRSAIARLERVWHPGAYGLPPPRVGHWRSTHPGTSGCSSMASQTLSLSE